MLSQGYTVFLFSTSQIVDDQILGTTLPVDVIARLRKRHKWWLLKSLDSYVYALLRVVYVITVHPIDANRFWKNRNFNKIFN